MKKILSFALAAIAALGLAACVEDNPWSGISGVALSVPSVEANTAVDVIATTVNISSATLFYQIGSGAAQSVAMTAGTAANTFVGTIPGQAAVGTVVAFWVVAEGTSGTSQSATQSFTVVAEAIDYTQLVLNEINGEQKFIEVYNKGTKAIDLKGVRVDRNDNASGFTVPNGPSDPSVMLPAGGYWVITANDYNPVPPPPVAALVHGALGSGLSAQQALMIRLSDPGDNVLDLFIRREGSASWGTTGPGHASVGTYTRSPNGTGGWFANTAANSTAGAANLPTTTPIPNLQTPGI
ncbi:MAG: lamin tail domain-containing protein [Rikenellaceae bacterium]|nr:lamin tail domain-containing protein [Rikenellaceae bacterium]MCL2692212.1 lamin tail domain-containing protein [Rikenellaceae bacterium]